MNKAFGAVITGIPLILLNIPWDKIIQATVQIIPTAVEYAMECPALRGGIL